MSQSARRAAQLALVVGAVALVAGSVTSASLAPPKDVVVTNTNHYGDPKTGCRPDEHSVTIDGILGDLCAPICHANATPACPADVPPGVTAKPECELTFKEGGKGCVLVCSPTIDEISLRNGDAQCGQGSCQPIQGVGVCTYGAPPPTGLPAGCVAVGAGTSTSVSCSGNASPEPGCEKVNRLCCLSQLDNTFAALQSYRAKTPFTSFTLECPGNFGGGDGVWSKKIGSLLKNMTGLTKLTLDLSYDMAGEADTILDAIEPVVTANPQLSYLALVLLSTNISDVGAARLGNLIHAQFKGHTLAINLGESDPSDLPHGKYITAVGAGEFATGIGNLQALRNLSVALRFDMNITARGLARLAVGLEPLQSTLQYLAFDFGYTDNNDPDPSGYPPDFACLGRIIGGFQHMQGLSLNLDGDIGDPETVRALGVHLACLPVTALTTLNDQDDCHCGLRVDKSRGCIVPNKDYSGDLGTGCFQCIAKANATSCPSM